MIKKTTILMVILITIFSSSLYSVESKIKIYAPKAPPSIPLIKTAQEMNNLEIIYYTDLLTEVLPKVLKGEEALFILPTNISAKIYNKNKKVKQIAVVSMGLIKIISSDKSINSIKDLKNSRISIPAPGSSPDIVSRYIFKSNNVKPKIIYGSTPEIAKLIMANKIKTAVLPEPMASLALFKNKNLRLIADATVEWKKINRDSNGIPQVGICINSDLAQKNSRQIKIFMKSYAKSVKWANSNPDAAAKLGADKMKLKIPSAVIRNSIPSMNLTYISGNKAYKELSIYFDILKQFDSKVIGGKLPDKKFILDL